MRNVRTPTTCSWRRPAKYTACAPLPTARPKSLASRAIYSRRSRPTPRHASARLIVFPEFAFSGAGWRTVEDIRSVALSFPGPELDQVCTFAQKNKIYVVFQQLEADDKMPGHVFDTVVSGERQRRYLAAPSEDAVCRLVRNAAGHDAGERVRPLCRGLWSRQHDPGCGHTDRVRSEQRSAPRTCFRRSRSCSCRRAPRFLTHSTSESFQSNPRHGWTTARQLMALTGVAYLISTDAGDVSGGTFQQFRPAGQSHLIDYNGTIQVLMEPGSPGVLLAAVDLAALRRARANPRRNIAIWDDPRVYGAAYAQGRGGAQQLVDRSGRLPVRQSAGRGGSAVAPLR